MVPVGAAAVLRGAVLHAAAAGWREGRETWRRRPTRHNARVFTGKMTHINIIKLIYYMHIQIIIVYHFIAS